MADISGRWTDWWHAAPICNIVHMGRVVQVDSPEADANDEPLEGLGHDNLHTFDGDSIHVRHLEAIRYLHSHLQRFWNVHEAAIRRIWQAMPTEQRQNVYQMVKPEQPETESPSYLMINGHKIPIEATNIALIPELSPESILENLLDLFSSWALPPIDIVAWQSLKYVRFCLSSGKIKNRPDEENGFCFVLGERFGHCAKMNDDADSKDKLAMQRCMRRGAICTIAEFSLLEDRLASVLLALAAVANEFSKALSAASAIEFQHLDFTPDPYISISDK